MRQDPRNIVMEAAREAAEEILGGYPRLRVVLFGSRVAGTGDERSDFDLGFDAWAPLPPEILARLRELFDDLPILQRVDVVDLAAASDRFKEISRRHEEVVHER